MKTTATNLYVKAVTLAATVAGLTAIAALGGKYRLG